MFSESIFSGLPIDEKRTVVFQEPRQSFGSWSPGLKEVDPSDVRYGPENKPIELAVTGMEVVEVLDDGRRRHVVIVPEFTQEDHETLDELRARLSESEEE